VIEGERSAAYASMATVVEGDACKSGKKMAQQLSDQRTGDILVYRLEGTRTGSREDQVPMRSGLYGTFSK